VLVVAAPGGAESSQEPSLNRRDVRRLQADRGSEIVVGLRILGIGGDFLLGEFDGAIHVGAELVVDFRRRFRQIDRRPRDVPM
jgi:hypothetical protein